MTQRPLEDLILAALDKGAVKFSMHISRFDEDTGEPRAYMAIITDKDRKKIQTHAFATTPLAALPKALRLYLDDAPESDEFDGMLD